jgi:CxxC motif-containing protein (DUF1111 family)
MIRTLVGSCVIAGVFLTCSMTSTSTSATAPRPGRRTDTTVSRAYSEARALFQKVWQPGEPSPAGGDGLGPLFNENSCVGCHHLGGVGGAGGNNRNVTLLTAFAGPPNREKGDPVFQGELEDLHPGFRNQTSIVLHKHATSPTDDARLTRIRTYDTVQTRDALIALKTSTRSTPALFGDGLIDRISDSDILNGETRSSTTMFPEIKGRASRLKDGRIGRFGWKGQSATLRDFVLGACANELGLEVPGHHQLTLDSQKRFDPKSLKADLSDTETELLVRFVASLARPVVRPVDIVLTSHGARVFEAIGCATCHSPKLGNVSGVYSDLLLHDLGALFRDSGGGYGMSSVPGRIVDGSTSTGDPAPSGTGEAGPTEWRTVPLWGVADSAPYLHDGRAGTLDEAIRLHGGEAAETARRYAKLPFGDRQALLAFLHSLRAPAVSSRNSPGKSARRT